MCTALSEMSPSSNGDWRACALLRQRVHVDTCPAFLPTAIAACGRLMAPCLGFLPGMFRRAFVNLKKRKSGTAVWVLTWALSATMACGRTHVDERAALCPTGESVYRGEVEIISDLSPARGLNTSVRVDFLDVPPDVVRQGQGARSWRQPHIRERSVGPCILSWPVDERLAGAVALIPIEVWSRRYGTLMISAATFGTVANISYDDWGSRSFVGELLPAGTEVDLRTTGAEVPPMQAHLDAVPSPPRFLDPLDGEVRQRAAPLTLRWQPVLTGTLHIELNSKRTFQDPGLRCSFDARDGEGIIPLEALVELAASESAEINAAITVSNCATVGRYDTQLEWVARSRAHRFVLR